MEEKLSPLCMSYHIPVYGSLEDCCAGLRYAICAQMLHDTSVHDSRCEHDTTCSQVYITGLVRRFIIYMKGTKVDSKHDKTCA
jgi:hypothetical protein